jgi:hypothetical protein
MTKAKYIWTFFIFGCLSTNAWSQRVEYNLHKLATERKLQAVGRELSPLEDSSYSGIRLSEEAGEEGLAWLSNVIFTGGSISFDVRGKDELQKSFVGIAFFGQNDSTYDAVYFRPFNFHAKDSVRRIHAVQYISHPVYTWKRLREERNAMYEKSVANPPDPNGWFHARVTIQNNRVEVFINHRKKPELSVELISKVRTGKVGLFVGAGSGGDFANFTIE